jgi:DNA invertase Pin-like site-specific DNA recombinase
MSQQTNEVSKRAATKQMVYAIVYSRTCGQAQSGQKINEQIKKCRKYARAQGYILEKEAMYQDVGSGTGEYTKRPGLVKILDYIDRFPGQRFVLIVTDIERITRDMHTLTTYGEALYSRGVLIESLDRASKQSSKDQMIEDLTFIFNRYERNAMRDRMLAAKRARPGADRK